MARMIGQIFLVVNGTSITSSLDGLLEQAPRLIISLQGTSPPVKPIIAIIMTSTTKMMRNLRMPTGFRMSGMRRKSGTVVSSRTGQLVDERERFSARSSRDPLRTQRTASALEARR
jgi:hypothetical protein